MPLIEYEHRNFKDSTMDVIDHANRLIGEYQAQGLSLTLRQLYYRFVASDLLDNTPQSYKRLGSIINDARVAGLVDWKAIEDRGRSLHRWRAYESPADLIRANVYQYHVDHWAEQDYRVEVWVEKQALEAVVGQAASELDCPYFACKGYTSQSEMWRAAKRLAGYAKAGQDPVIIHLGDHDPSGIDMTRDITDRLNDLFGVDVHVERIALNMDQIREFRPPPNPAKLTDSRAAGYIETFDTRSSWELDAIEPAAMRVMIQESIRGFLDQDMFDERVEEMERGQDLLRSVSENWERVVELAEELSQ